MICLDKRQLFKKCYAKLHMMSQHYICTLTNVRLDQLPKLNQSLSSVSCLSPHASGWSMYTYVQVHREARYQTFNWRWSLLPTKRVFLISFPKWNFSWSGSKESLWGLMINFSIDVSIHCRVTHFVISRFWEAQFSAIQIW